MTGLFAELRVATRGMMKSPGVTLLAMLTLALGIGMNTLMFGIVYGALYRGLPFPEGDRVIHISRTNPTEGMDRMSVTLHDFVDWRERQTTVEALAAGRGGTINMGGMERPTRFDGEFVTANAFESLRVQPILGRTFEPGEEGPDAPHVAILAYHVWQNHFDGSPDILGTTVRINGQPTSIIGVMPEGFLFPQNQEVWVPLRDNVLEMERGSGYQVDVWGRLPPGVTVEQVGAEFAAIAQSLAEEYPETNEGVSTWVQPYTKAFMDQESEIVFLTMLATTLLVLLVACTNVANLLLARAAGRTKELAITVALGASRQRVMGKLVAEAVVLVATGALIGVGLARIGMDIVLAKASTEPPPFWFDFSFDGPIILFVVLASGLAALVAGVVPGLKVTATRVHEILKDESRGSSSLRIGRLSRLLVISELAFSVGLLVSAGLMVKGMLRLQNLDYGFKTEEVFTSRIGLFETDFPTPESRQVFFRDLQDRLEARPEIRAASLTTSLPGLFGEGTAVGIQGAIYQDDQDYPNVAFAPITPGFFETFGVAVEGGRAFNDGDDATALQVAVVNRSFADQFFPNEDPVGQQIRMGGAESQEPWLTVVGLVPDMYIRGVSNPDQSQAGFYVPLAQVDRRFISIAAIGSGPPLALTPVVQEVVSSIHSDTPLYWVRDLRTGIKETIWHVDLFGGLFAIFGLLALLLAAAGLYAVMATGVAQRTREMGVRMALGAGSNNVLGMVLKQGTVQLALGLVIGFLLAGVLSRGLRVVLFGVEPWDPTVFLAIALIMTVSGLSACLIPAYRATRVDPVEALRTE